MEREKRKTVFQVVDEYFKRAETMAERMFASGWNEVACSIEPLSNIFVGATEVVVTIDLPYCDSESVKLKIIDEDTLEVYAKTRQMIRLDDFGIKHRKGEFSCFHTVIHVPLPVNEEGMSSKLKRGVLEIHLPRAI